MEYFSDYVTGGFYYQSNFKHTVNRLSDNNSATASDTSEKSWSDFFKTGSSEETKNS